MDGSPVWLASISRRSARTGWINGVERWSARVLRRMEEFIDEEILAGVGDADRQRSFRMNVTLCRHRALTPEEVAGLPDSFHDAPAIDIAGGPVEVLWENVPTRPSTQPCESPGRYTMDAARPDLWVPVDCGRCAPCRARAQIETYCPTAIVA